MVRVAKIAKILCPVIVILFLCSSTNVAGMNDPPQNKNFHFYFSSSLDSTTTEYNNQLNIFNNNNTNIASGNNNNAAKIPEIQGSQNLNTTEIVAQLEILISADEKIDADGENVKSVVKTDNDNNNVGKKEERTQSCCASNIIDAITWGAAPMVYKIRDISYRFCEAYHPVQYWAHYWDEEENPAWFYPVGNEQKDWATIEAALNADSSYIDYVEGRTKSTKYLIPVAEHVLSDGERSYNHFLDESPLPAERFRYHDTIYRVNWVEVDKAVKRYLNSQNPEGQEHGYNDGYDDCWWIRATDFPILGCSDMKKAEEKERLEKEKKGETNNTAKPDADTRSI